MTLAHLPSHFLLPFTTVIERPPPTSEGQPSKIKAHIKPGLRSEHPEESLGQLSYVINRQDVVRHLSRRKNWTNLVTDRQRGKGASIAHRSPNAQRLLQDYWVWDDKAVEAAAVLLENRVKAALEDAIEAMKADGLSTMAREEQPAFVLALAASRPGDETGEVRSKPEVPFYDLPDLLSAEILDGLKEDYSLSDTVYVPKSPKALRAQLALEKLKAHKESSGSMKQLP